MVSISYITSFFLVAAFFVNASPLFQKRNPSLGLDAKRDSTADSSGLGGQARVSRPGLTRRMNDGHPPGAGHRNPEFIELMRQANVEDDKAQKIADKASGYREGSTASEWAKEIILKHREAAAKLRNEALHSLPEGGDSQGSV